MNQGVVRTRDSVNLIRSSRFPFVFEEIINPGTVIKKVDFEIIGEMPDRQLRCYAKLVVRQVLLEIACIPRIPVENNGFDIVLRSLVRIVAFRKFSGSRGRIAEIFRQIVVLAQLVLEGSILQ